MYVECPSCRKYFPVTALMLGRANGMLKCGSCNATFNSLLHLRDDAHPPTPVLKNEVIFEEDLHIPVGDVAPMVEMPVIPQPVAPTPVSVNYSATYTSDGGWKAADPPLVVRNGVDVVQQATVSGPAPAPDQKKS